MATDRNQAAREKRAREKKELERLTKRKDDFVKRHLAAGTAAGRGYEKELQKRQKAIDEYYATTLHGIEERSRKKKQDAAATESIKLEAQITELREAPGHRSREKKREKKN